ncbi:MAG: putative resolvase, partial [Mycobacterium sp.]|nr:putative resolvase [Mycobacterium sp.]
MDLAVWAGRSGVTWVTACCWFRAGLLAVAARKVGRLVLLDDDPSVSGEARLRAAVYAWVSSADRRADLDRQVVRVTAWVMTEQIPVGKVVTEVGSALNGHGRRFLALLRDR